MGDFNEVVGASMSGFAKITTEFELVDVLAHFHSIKRSKLKCRPTPAAPIASIMYSAPIRCYLPSPLVALNRLITIFSQIIVLSSWIGMRCSCLAHTHLPSPPPPTDAFNPKECDLTFGTSNR
jgi:hypothetical protein